MKTNNAMLSCRGTDLIQTQPGFIFGQLPSVAEIDAQVDSVDIEIDRTLSKVASALLADDACGYPIPPGGYIFYIYHNARPEPPGERRLMLSRERG